MNVRTRSSEMIKNMQMQIFLEFFNLRKITCSLALTNEDDVKVYCKNILTNNLVLNRSLPKWAEYVITTEFYNVYRETYVISELIRCEILLHISLNKRSVKMSPEICVFSGQNKCNFLADHLTSRVKDLGSKPHSSAVRR